jgi:hypothetical protein
VSKFKDITVVVMHGNGGVDKEMAALEKTAAGLPGCKTLVITNELINTKHPQKLVYQKLDYFGIQEFMVYCMHNYIKTEYALIVQSDGWLLNADNWDDRWFEYDYVGAYTHAAIEGDKFYWWYSWEKECKNPMVVQNGGFSLRSRKLLAAPTRYGIVKHFQNGDTRLWNEDIQLCCWMRPALENIGLKFAPFEVAKYFSFEHLSPGLHKGLDLTKMFGHHSRFRRLTGPNDMTWQLTEEETNKISNEIKVLELFKHYGYTINGTDYSQVPPSERSQTILV